MNKKTVYLGSDHGGFELKEEAKSWFEDWGFSFHDVGAHALVSDDDYPDYAVQVSKKVVAEPGSVGILFCRSGAGMTIAANKVKGVRAALAYDRRSASHAVEHNDANIISVPADWIDKNQGREIVASFLNAEFSGAERHLRRINKIAELEK